MNQAALRKQVAEQRSIVQAVLQAYLQTHACPCAWPQFIYWVGKQRPSGSYDPIQNMLVEAALALPTFTQSPPATPQYWLEAEVSCSACGARWLYFCEEWRMLGFHKQLIPLDGQGSALPADLTRLSGEVPGPNTERELDAWAQFMQRDLPGESKEEKTP